MICRCRHRHRQIVSYHQSHGPLDEQLVSLAAAKEATSVASSLLAAYVPPEVGEKVPREQGEEVPRYDGKKVCHGNAEVDPGTVQYRCAEPLFTTIARYPERLVFSRASSPLRVLIRHVDRAV